MKTFKTIFSVFIFLTILSAGMAPVSFAAGQPDLTVQIISSISPLPEKAESGGVFSVTTKIKNKGKKQAIGNFSTQYYLSSNNSYSSEDILLTGSRTVSGLKSKKTVIGRTNLIVPLATPPGDYYLIACVDDKNAISESNESNNCTASRITINVANNSVDVVMPANDDVKNVPVTTGLNEFTFTYNIPGGANNYDSISADSQDILTNSLTITPVMSSNNIMKFLASFISTADAITPATITARIGSSVDTVCEQGLLYPLFTYYGSGYVSPSTASASPASVSIIKSGSMAICIQVYSPIDATINVSDVSVNITPCNKKPAIIGGKWKGKYTCINYGWKNEVNKDVDFTITQDIDNKYKAEYVDGNAKYTGTVCGNVFKFDGGEPGLYTESGTFVLNKNGTGTKNSTWSSVSPGTNWGTCSDEIHLVKKQPGLK